MPRRAPFLSDIPAAEALAAWLGAVPERLAPVELALADALGRVTAAPLWALRSSPAYDASAMDGIAVRAADTFGATETAPRKLEAFHRVDTGDGRRGVDGFWGHDRAHRATPTGSAPGSVTRWITRCWSPKSPTTECCVARLSQKPIVPSVQW